MLSSLQWPNLHVIQLSCLLSSMPTQPVSWTCAFIWFRCTVHYHTWSYESARMLAGQIEEEKRMYALVSMRWSSSRVKKMPLLSLNVHLMKLYSLARVIYLFFVVLRHTNESQKYLCNPLSFQWEVPFITNWKAVGWGGYALFSLHNRSLALIVSG